ncbi:fibrous sheath CABYR-binding protein-like [Lucilia sericata]|uniref:fibrous sheath CABYR-binding protein-like n=1 Tax=Lucilia sericata TaxID=13632 RepID=UPI0018A84F2C|nr:fibrous sheath CABYR-binding protein-like [Lucilia sericata]
MFKFTAIVVLALAICVVADPIRQKPLRRRVSARQQALPTPAPTGYPAAGVTPEIPFELPTETEKPEIVTQQPDEVYGPPEVDAQQPDEVYGPPETETQQPDEVYGPPEAEVQQPDEVYGPPETETQQPDEVYGPPETDATPEIVEVVPVEAEEETEAEEVAEDLDEVDEEIVVDENGAVISVSNTFEKPARLVYQRFPQRRQPPTAVPARLTKAKVVKPVNFVYTARFQTFLKN